MKDENKILKDRFPGRHYSHLNTAADILILYNGEEPFHLFLKNYFRERKKYGSRDRKEIAELCYCFFRAGRAFPDMELKERILSSMFICSAEAGQILQIIKPEWNQLINESAAVKIKHISHGSIEELFPWKNKLSDDVDAEKFIESLFIQPDVFIRVRPGFESVVETKINASDQNFKKLSAQCYAFPPTTKIESFLAINREVVVQDYNSQRIGDSTLR